LKLEIKDLKVIEPPTRADLRVDLTCPHCEKELTLYIHPADGVTEGISQRKCVFCQALLSFEWKVKE